MGHAAQRAKGNDTSTNLDFNFQRSWVEQSPVTVGVGRVGLLRLVLSGLVGGPRLALTRGVDLGQPRTCNIREQTVGEPVEIGPQPGFVLTATDVFTIGAVGALALKRLLTLLRVQFGLPGCRNLIQEDDLLGGYKSGGLKPVRLLPIADGITRSGTEDAIDTARVIVEHGAPSRCVGVRAQRPKPHVFRASVSPTSRSAIS